MFAIGGILKGIFEYIGTKSIQPVAVCSPVSDWIVVHGDVATADNAGSAITVPSTQIIDADAHVLSCLGLGTSVQLCVQYTAARTLSTDPIFNLFGLSAADGTSTPAADTTTGLLLGQFAQTATGSRIAGIPTGLRTAALAYDFTIADDATNDPSDGTYKYTQVTTVDLIGLPFFGVGVKTAGVLSGAGTAKLLARFF